MKIVTRRFLFENETALSYMLVNDAYECFVLEDLPRDKKIKGQTAIPQGVYRITIQQSPHFGRLMPYLVDVPNYSGVMIHWGTKKEDTEGCLLVAQNVVDLAHTSGSRLAFDNLFVKLQRAFDAKEDIFISVEDYIRPI